jgi:hypothetical protein
VLDLVTAGAELHAVLRLRSNANRRRRLAEKPDGPTTGRRTTTLPEGPAPVC